MDQVTEEEAKNQRDLHHHALRGDVVEVGGMDIAHNIEENNPNSEKARRKKEAEQQFVHMVIEIQEAYNAFMDRLNVELGTIRQTIIELENDMTQNRLIWDAEIEILDDIDDVFCNFDDGGELDCDKARETIIKAGFDVPENAINVQLITLLQDIRKERLQSIETLDTDYLILEGNHKQFRAREKEVLNAKQQLQEIGNDATLDNNQKLVAIANLRDDVGSKILHAAATFTQEEKVSAKADKVVDEDVELDQIDKSVSVTNSVSSLNF